MKNTEVRMLGKGSRISPAIDKVSKVKGTWDSITRTQNNGKWKTYSLSPLNYLSKYIPASPLRFTKAKAENREKRLHDPTLNTSFLIFFKIKSAYNVEEGQVSWAWPQVSCSMATHFLSPVAHR